jgi:hypothetical protein
LLAGRKIQAPEDLYNLLKSLVTPAGFEPATLRLGI